MRTWDLFKEMDLLNREFDHLFNDYNRGHLFGHAFATRPGMRLYPKINLRDDSENIYVEALLPGVEPDKIDMNVLGNTFTLAGERHILDEDKNGRIWHRRERGTGKFIRTVELPVDIVTDKVKAEYHNGMLQVTLPKAAKAKPKKISVEIR